MKKALLLCLLACSSHTITAQCLYPYNDYICRSSLEATENWQCLGPLAGAYGPGANIYQGRVDAIWVNPNDSNCILLGSDGGGLWKSNNDGHSWRCITDNINQYTSGVYGMAGVSSIAVCPLDTNIIYISVEVISGENKRSAGTNLGMMYTTDGGSHWYNDDTFNGLVSNNHIPAVTKVAYMPGTEQLLAISEGVVLYKANTLTAWSNITPPLISAGGLWCTDLNFSKQTTGNAIVSTSALNDTSHLCVYNTGSATWSDTKIAPASATQVNYSDGIMRFTVTANDTAYIMISLHNSGHLWQLMKTSIYVANLSMLNPSIAITADNIYQMAVSDANPNVIYTANYTSSGYGEVFTQSVDQGTSFSEISSGEHPDGRCLYIWSTGINPVNDMVYFGCDGGICKKRMGNTNTESITGNGLGITQFFGFGNTEGDEDIMYGGAQDNGGWGYIKTNTSPWSNDFGGDGYNAKFLAPGENKAIGEVNGGGDPFVPYQADFSGGGISAFYMPAQPDSPVSNINRPIHVAQDSAAYMGYCHIWKLPPGGRSWQNAFLSDPIDHGAFAFKKLANDFYINEQDNDSAYVNYRDATFDGVNYHDPANDTFGKLYFSHNAASIDFAFPPSWQNITPSIVDTYGVSTIAVDPNNTSRIWVGFSGTITYELKNFSAPVTDRVWYSSNAGNTWTDVSTGLTPLSVDKLLYRKGSNDEIYAATGAGVYKWIPGTNRWECYNNGLPSTEIMDLEFNYCAGKLRAAAWGRGIWETPLDNINVGADVNTTITSNTTWSTDQYIESSILIQPGATLTLLNQTTHMPKNGAIVVAAGGRLVVSGSAITNDCSGCMWKGIQLEGSATMPQTPANDGWVTIKNNSVIQHAKAGVANYDIWASTGTGTGGICQATNGSFIDDSVAVSLVEYHNWNTAFTLLSPNRSNCTNSSFIWDDAYRGDALGFPPGVLVNLYGVEGTGFNGSQFLNRDTMPARKLQGEGIHSLDAAFTVGANCPTGTVCLHPSVLPRFCGFTNGIDIQGTAGANLTVSIDQASFDSVSVGVNVASANNVSVTQSSFTVGHGLQVNDISYGTQSTGCYQNIGILLQAPDAQFWMEANTFTGKNNGIGYWYNFGAVVNNIDIGAATAPFTDVIYRNAFDSLTIGACSIGKNNGATYFYEFPGLQITCNTFNNNNDAIEVLTDGDPSIAAPDYEGIGQYQSPPSTDAGNVYNGATNNIINNTVTPVGFYIYNPTAEWPHTGSPTITGAYSMIVSAANTCPAQLPPLPNVQNSYTAKPLPLRLSHRQAYLSSLATYSSTLASYTGLMDFGNTDSLLHVIDTSSNNTALYSTLMTGTPYLSMQVIDTVANLAKISYAQMMNVLVQTPDDVRNPGFLAYVNSDYSFTPTDMATLQTASAGVTGRTAQENTMGAAQMAMAGNGNIMMMMLKTAYDTGINVNDTTGAGICTDSNSVYYLLDSSSAYVGLDSTDLWLQSIGGPWSAYARVGYYNFMGQTGIADSIFTSVNSLLPAPGAPGYAIDSAEYAAYSKVWKVTKSAEAAGRNITNLDSAEAMEIDTATTPQLYFSAPQLMMAGLSVIHSGGGGRIPTSGIACAPTFAGRKSNGNSSMPPTGQVSAGTIGNRQLSVFPNPASGVVTFVYNAPGGGDITITVSSLVGEKVMEQHTQNTAGSVYWNPATVAAGVYIYKATNANGIIGMGKVVVMGKQ
jgi:hypothetical protein